MKKKIALLTILSMLTAPMVGCGHDHDHDHDHEEHSYEEHDHDEAELHVVEKPMDEKLNVVCTIYPVYNWLQEIGGDRVNVEFLLDSGIDLHNYTPNVQELITMQESDLFVYVGGDSDSWATDVVDGSFNALNLMNELGEHTLDQEESEGMQGHDHGHEEHEESLWCKIQALFGHDRDHDHDLPDEHIWMSPKKAEMIVEDIVEALSEVDPEYADMYMKNGEVYLEQLKELDAKYQEELAGIDLRTIVVADRFPLLYMTEDYGMEYYGAFSGCSAEVEVSFDTIKFLADKMLELELKYIFKIEGSNVQIADTVMSEIGGSKDNILEINSMQSVLGGDGEYSYISLMEENLDVLKVALNNQ